MGENFPRIDFRNLSWEEYALLSAILLSLIAYGLHISQFKQLPSPIFGGDIYRDRGFVKNIVAGNPVWSDGFYANEIQYYPYLVFAIQALMVKITGASVDAIVLWFPLITLCISAIAWYLLGLRIFKNKKFALLLSLAFIGLIHWYFPKSAGVALFFTVPMFLYFLLKYEQENKITDAVYAGLFLGLTSLVWGGIFLGISFTAVLVVVYFLIMQLLENRKHHNSLRFFSTIRNFMRKYYLIIVIALIISMIFFLPLIIKYHLKEYNFVTKWGDEKIENLGPKWILTNLRYMFFDTTNIITLIYTLIALVGILGLIVSKKKSEAKFVLAFFFANIIVLQHHLLTRPLLNWSFLPQKMVYLNYFLPVFFVYGIIVIYSFLKSENTKKAVFVLAILIIVLAFIYRYNNMLDDQWDKVGRSNNSYVSALYELGDFIENNIKDETILSNDESGFMLAVVSGRKVMLTRRTHASYYVDIDRRIADAAVAMYGNNITLTKEILSKYNVKYFYLDQNIFQNYMRVRPDLKQYLTDNNISFIEAYDRYDIAVPPEDANMQNLLLIPPQNLSNEFISLWVPIYTVMVQGQTVGQLYRLKE